MINTKFKVYQVLLCMYHFNHSYFISLGKMKKGTYATMRGIKKESLNFVLSTILNTLNTKNKTTANK